MTEAFFLAWFVCSHAKFYSAFDANRSITYVKEMCSAELPGDGGKGKESDPVISFLLEDGISFFFLLGIASYSQVQ